MRPKRPLERWTGNPAHSNLWYLRAGEHFLILAVETDRVVVLDIPHTRSNPLTYLDGKT